MKSNILKTLNLVLVLILFTSIKSNSTVIPQNGCTGCEGKKKTLSRSFREVNSQSTNNSAISFTDFRSNHNYKSEISLDMNDFINIYSSKDIEYNYSAEGVSYTMDIGIVDYDNPQTWIMPTVNFVNTEIGENAVLSESVYFELFPEATHLKLYAYPEEYEIFSEFYKFSAEKIEIIGGVLETNIYKGVFIDTLSYLMTTLPLDLNTDFMLKDTLNFNDTTYAIESNIWVEGYGTLQTSDGTFEALKIANEYYEDIYVNGELDEEYSEMIYTFYCTNGYRLDLVLATGSPLTGTVNINYVYYEYPVTQTLISEISQKSDFCYPNPATNILNFNKIGNYQIYNSLGTKVSTLENVQSADISSLNSGLYFVKSETGKTQKIIINN